MNSTTQTEMIDAQARVIRSLNLVHSADTQYMIGAVQLENLFKLKTENDELKQRMKDDGEYIYIIGTRNQDYREALLNARNEVKQLKETIKELQEVNEYLRQKNDKLEYGRMSK